MTKQKKDTTSSLERLANSAPVRESRYIDLSVDIAGQIQNYLEHEGLSQNAFAEQLGKHPSEISKWTSGFHNFTLKTLALLEEATGVRMVASQTEVEDEMKAAIRQHSKHKPS